MRQLWLAAVALATLACTHLSSTPHVPPPAGELEARRILYRVRYEGPGGSGSLRLVLRQVATDRFRLQASDAFGRAVWGLDLDGEEVVLVDHRKRRACVSGKEVRVPELALRPLPLTAVPRVLSGRTPLRAPADTDESDWTDGAGQRWTSRRQGERLESWTLWQSGQPRLWWRRQPRGGVLSHRDGSQFRWRQVAQEHQPPSGYQRVVIPPDYESGECDAEAGWG